MCIFPSIVSWSLKARIKKRKEKCVSVKINEDVFMYKKNKEVNKCMNKKTQWIKEKAKNVATTMLEHI